MSKAKIIAGAGIIAAGAALSGLPEPNAAKAESPEQTAKEITVGAQPSALQIAELNAAAGHLPDNETFSMQNHAPLNARQKKSTTVLKTSPPSAMLKLSPTSAANTPT